MRIHALALLLSLPLGNARAQGQVSLLALRTDDRVIALASRDGKALGNEPLLLRSWRRDLGQHNESVRTDANGLAVLELRPDLLPRSPILVLRGDGSCAVAAIEPGSPERDKTTTTAHLFVDRPVYRPGEIVRGRVLLRESKLGERGPSSLPLMGCAVELTLTLRDGTKVERALTTDLQGCACFAVELPDDARAGTVSIHVRCRGFECTELAFEVREFRRPSVLCELEGAPVTKLDGSYLLDVRAAFGAGGPAAGLQGRLLVRGEPRGSFTLDRAGRARIEAGKELMRTLADLDTVCFEVELLGLEGVACRAEHRLERRAARQAGPPAPVAANVGERLLVSVRGRPDELGLVCVANRSLCAAQVVKLDRDGHGEAGFTVERAWLPRVQIVGHGCGEPWRVFDGHRGTPFDLAVSESVSIALAEAGRRFEPGTELELHLRTAGSDGRGKPTVLALAVVDQEVFAAFEDSMRDPRETLSPRLDQPAVRREVTIADSCRGLVLSSLFLGGHLHGWPTLATVRRPGPSAPCGGSSPGTSGPADLPPRSRFEATAAFLGAVPTDAGGSAIVRIRMPDDLTRWRVTVVAVDGGCAAATLRAEISTEKELAVTAALPRFLREGDELVATRLVHRGKREVVASPLRLSGQGLGVLPVELEVQEGRLHDSMRVKLPILPAVAWLPWCTTASVTGRTELAPPLGVSAGEPCELVLLSGREAILAEARRFVGEYPYGCVEQTTSRLLPHLAALRADPRPDAGRRAKIDSGLRRLRQMLVGVDRGFRYWPGWGGVDERMSAYVVHALCLAREAGIDLQRFGLGLTPECGGFGHLARRIERRDLAVTDSELDLALALARYGGERGAHAQALCARLDVLELSARQLAAAALALPRDRAGKLVERALAAALRDGMRPADLAMLLIALHRVGGHADDIGRVEARLLSLHRDGRFGTTFDTAMAVAALAGSSRVPTGDGPFVVDVARGRVHTSVRVGAGAAEVVRVPLPISEPIVVTPPAGREVVAMLRGRLPLLATSREPAQTFSLSRRLVDAASGREVRRFLRAGQLLELVVELRDAGEHDYVAIDCPIPAGFEVLGEPPGWEVHDDRAVFALAHTGAEAARAELTLVAAFAGEVAWPPATVVAMYDERQRGCTAPERLVILPR